MKYLYVDAFNELPPNPPKPRRRPIHIDFFVESGLAGDRVTRRSQTGILLYFSSAHNIFYYKQQNTVQSSTFGSEFAALRISSDLIISMQYNLHMFGININGTDYAFCDNEADHRNSTFPELKLRRKNQYICYHTLFSIIKSSLLKLLCTLVLLFEGNPLQPLRLNFFGIDFPLHPLS